MDRRDRRAEVDHGSKAPVSGDDVAGHHVRVYPGIRPVSAGQPGGVVPDGPCGIGVDQSVQVLDGVDREVMLVG